MTASLGKFRLGDELRNRRGRERKTGAKMEHVAYICAGIFSFLHGTFHFLLNLSPVICL